MRRVVENVCEAIERLGEFEPVVVHDALRIGLSEFLEIRLG